MASSVISPVLPDIHVVLPARSMRRTIEVSRVECYWVFGSVFTLCTAVAAWFALVVQDVISDALSRTLAAVTAAHSAYPKLASLGFIWPPLPSIMQVPLVEIPALATYGFSGGIVCALFAGGTAVVFDLVFARAGLSRSVRFAALALLMILNPFMLFYSVNGMSEMPFIFCVAAATYCFLRWTDTEQSGWLTAAGVASALMVLTRYDAVFYSAAFAFAVIFVLWGQSRDITRTERGASRQSFVPMVSANVAMYLTPVIFMTTLWVFFNWQIEGNALYFLNSVYSNAYLFSLTGLTPIAIHLQSSPIVFLTYILETIFGLSPLLLITLFVLAALAVIERSAKRAALILLLLIVPLFEWMSFRQGQTFGFWRYYITLIPAGAIAGAEVVRLAPNEHARRATVALLLGGLAFGALTIAVVMDIGGHDRFMDSKPICSSVSVVDRDFLHALVHPTEKIDACAPERNMASYIITHTHDRAVLTDISGEGVVVMSAQPSRFVLLSDGDYNTIARNPAGAVDYLLVARGDLAYHALDGYFTDLDAPNPPGLTLEYQSGKLKLYRIPPDYQAG